MSRHQVFVDWGKLLQIVIIIGATVALSLANKISADAVMLILGGAAGYVFGNGKSVKEGLPPAPLLSRRAIPFTQDDGTGEAP